MKKVWIINPRRRAKRVTPKQRARALRLHRAAVIERVVRSESKRKVGHVAKRRRKRAVRRKVVVARVVRRKRKWGSAAQRAAFKKMIAARAGRGAVRRRKVRRVARKRHPGVASMARRRRKSRRRSGGVIQSVRRGGKKVSRGAWRASGYRRNPRRRHRRHFARNPFSLGGIKHRVVQGVTDAALILGGKAGARFIANFAPDSLKDTVPKVALTQVVAALAVGIAGTKFLGGDKGRFLLAGGVAGALESFLKGFDATKDNVGKLLGDDFLELGDGYTAGGIGNYLPGIAGYGEPDVDEARFGGSPSGIGDYAS